nr:transglycosylase domain-containing protein [Escherichia coli]
MWRRCVWRRSCAQRYFHKPASKLTRSEAALLAAVLPNPLRFKVSSPSATCVAVRRGFYGRCIS